MSRVLRIVQRCRGIWLGLCEEVFEMDFPSDATPSPEEIMGWLAKPDAMWGRAYDGAYVVRVSKNRGWMFYLKPGVVRFKDYHRGWVIVRFMPGELERRLRRAVEA